MKLDKDNRDSVCCCVRPGDKRMDSRSDKLVIGVFETKPSTSTLKYY